MNHKRLKFAIKWRIRFLINVSLFQCGTCSLTYMNLNRYLLNTFKVFTGTYEVYYGFYNSFVLSNLYIPSLLDIILKYKQSDLTKQLYLALLVLHAYPRIYIILMNHCHKQNLCNVILLIKWKKKEKPKILS